MPDDLLRRVKQTAIERKTTLRVLVIEALEQSVSAPAHVFRLRDASVAAAAGSKVSPAAINQVIDEQRQRPFTP